MVTRNPVIDVYDLLRTARLNVRYLETQIRQLQRWNLTIEIVLAVSASSVAGGLWILQNELGSYFWKLLGSVAALLAIIKPIINLTRTIKRKEGLLSGYRALDHDLHKISVLINQRQAYDSELQKQFLDALDRKGLLVQQDQESSVNKKLRERCYQEVLLELPAETLYLPEE